jgi:hypothetical protein
MWPSFQAHSTSPPDLISRFGFLRNGARLISDLAHAINGVLFGEIDHACVCRNAKET